MNWQTIQSNWSSHIPSLMTLWPTLLEDELLATDGRQDAVVTYIAASKG